MLRRVCEETLEFILRELQGPEGGFASALDADSEGEEGRFYVWSFDDVLDALDPQDAEAAVVWLGVTAQGNFEGTNVLESRGPEPPPEQRERIRAQLMEVRDRRVRPGLDDKRLTAWNALALGALAEAGARLGREDLLDAARRNAGFLLGTMRDEQGRLLRTSDGRTAKLNAYLEDHAFLLEALLDLYEATFEPRWFAAAREIADAMIDRYADPERGGFFSTSDDHEPLVARRKDLEDNPIPSGSSSAALGLLRLAALTGEERYERHGRSVLRLLHPFAARHPQAFGHLLLAIAFALHPPREVALAGEDRARAGAGAARAALARRGARRRRRSGCRRRAAAGRPHAGRRPGRRLRVRALRLPAAGHGPGGARVAPALGRVRSGRASLRCSRARSRWRSWRRRSAASPAPARRSSPSARPRGRARRAPDRRRRSP